MQLVQQHHCCGTELQSFAMFTQARQLSANVESNKGLPFAACSYSESMG